MAREARQHELELRKLELSQQNQPLNDESGRRVEIGPKIQLTQITTKFDEKHDEISLYLINFERKAELAQLPKKDWVAYLLAVLPAELSNMLAREPTERANNYDFVKDLILKRYRLNSEKLKQCFYRHQKSAEKSWRNYAHELNSYFTEWIAELQVKTFEQLKDLLITEQLKYRVPAEVREHFLDDWIKLKTPYELAEKLDEHENIKQSFRREIHKKNSYKFQGGINYSGARPKETPKDFKSKFQIKREPIHEKNNEKDFEKRLLVIAPSRPNKLSVQWVGPGEIVQQLSETNYVVKFPEKDKTHVYHVNMLKPYQQREENINLLCVNPLKQCFSKGGAIKIVIEKGGASIESLRSTALKHDEEEDIPSLELENERSGWSKIISDVQLNSKLSQIQRGQLKELLYEYSNLFSNIPGCTDLAEHDIELESERAIVLLSLIGKEARPCIDYRRLNKVTRTQFFPLPNIEELLEKVSAAKYISILDLTRGYWQIPLSPRAQRYALFVTTFGTFKPLRLPFGLKNVPYYFSRLMANLLRNCEDFAVPYLDDIAIFSLAWDDHLKHLKDVFDHLRSAKLHIKPSKCQFAQEYVKYLGHLIGQGLRTPGELKVQVIKDFPIPTNKTQVRAFLGLSGYYRRYIPEFSVIAAPLTVLLKGRNRKSTVDWNSSCQNAFEELKTRLSKNPVLYSPDFTKPFIIQCDASNLGIGVVLSQVCENEEHPIMFLSKMLSLAEQKYSTTEKECAAIIFAVQKLKCYLDGHQKFVIQTDHNPLVWLRKGKQNQNADSLSRIP
ncbi:retrovirus-related Pol polyprotein from transposon 297 [Trichonephila clavipes]|nr:retrovirus-related Pol polyprotein from transposon 297 [Trichonephila clavipes]